MTTSGRGSGEGDHVGRIEEALTLYREIDDPDPVFELLEPVFRKCTIGAIERLKGQVFRADTGNGHGSSPTVSQYVDDLIQDMRLFWYRKLDEDMDPSSGATIIDEDSDPRQLTSYINKTTYHQTRNRFYDHYLRTEEQPHSFEQMVELDPNVISVEDSEVMASWSDHRVSDQDEAWIEDQIRVLRSNLVSLKKAMGIDEYGADQADKVAKASVLRSYFTTEGDVRVVGLVT